METQEANKFKQQQAMVLTLKKKEFQTNSLDSSLTLYVMR
jgi:hypothetical protein